LSAGGKLQMNAELLCFFRLSWMQLLWNFFSTHFGLLQQPTWLHKYCFGRNSRCLLMAGLPDFLSAVYQNGEKFTKWPQNYPWVIKCTTIAANKPDGHKIHQHFPYQGAPKRTTFGILVY
jgi:hypothetical protein